ncbi:hypothetical protein EI94DRAFT_1741858, partial [Lactarius quietus]
AQQYMGALASLLLAHLLPRNSDTIHFIYVFPIACMGVFSTSASCYNTTFLLHFHSTRCSNILIWPSSPFQCRNLYRRPFLLPCVRTTA